MNIKPIRNEKDYEKTLKEVDQLFDAEPGTAGYDRLEVLLILVEAYEEKHYPIGLPDPIEAIKYHLESRGLTNSDLEPYIGTRTRVWEIMNRKRSLSLNMIRNLSEGLGIPAEILVQPYPAEEPAADPDATPGRPVESAFTPAGLPPLRPPRPRTERFA